MKQNYKKAIIIVAYEPDIGNLRRLSFLLEENKFIPIIADNSEKINVNRKDVSDSSVIITLGCNEGIAKAQNVGVRKAEELGCNIIGFLDQDSEIDSACLHKLENAIEENPEIVIAPVSIDKTTGEEYPSQRLNKIGYPYDVFVKGKSNKERVDIVISSGTMTSTRIIKEVGLMDEDFFIDFVDIEWCLRCKKKGVAIFVDPEAVLYHSIGTSDKKVLRMVINNHSAYRTYYKVRNSFLIFRKKMGLLFSLRQLIPAVGKNFISAVSSENKKMYFHYYFKAIRDGLNGKTGKLIE